jgi:hypothetical protein
LDTNSSQRRLKSTWECITQGVAVWDWNLQVAAELG